MLLQMALFHSFFWLSNNPLCVCVCVCSHTVSSLSIHLSVDTGCFHVLHTVNSAAMNTGVHVFELWFSPDTCPGVGLLGRIHTGKVV